MVQVESLDRLMKEHPFFADFQGEDMALLAGCAQNERFAAGEFIFQAGDPADKFYIVRFGTVALELQIPGRDRLVLQTVEEDDILGWSWIVPPYRSMFDARAVTLVRAVSLDGACLRGKLEENHELGFQLMKKMLSVLDSRLSSARLQLVDMYAPLSQAGRAFTPSDPAI